MQAVSFYRERSGSKCGVCLQMPATTRAHALGAGRTGSQERHAFAALHWRPTSQSTLLQSTRGGSKRSQQTGTLAGQWAEAPCRPACNAPAPGVPPRGRLSPPRSDSDDRENAIVLCREQRLRGQFQPSFFFWRFGGKKTTVISGLTLVVHILRASWRCRCCQTGRRSSYAHVQVFRKPGDTMFSQLIHWFASAA